MIHNTKPIRGFINKWNGEKFSKFPDWYKDPLEVGEEQKQAAVESEMMQE